MPESHPLWPSFVNSIRAMTGGGNPSPPQTDASPWSWEWQLFLAGAQAASRAAADGLAKCLARGMASGPSIAATALLGKIEDEIADLRKRLDTDDEPDDCDDEPSIWGPCVICKANLVNYGAGDDTCHVCLKSLYGAR